MFFEQIRNQFFRPLTSKYREQVVEALKELYKRLYTSSSADYGHALSRDDLIDTFSAALARAPELPSDDEDFEGRFRNNRDQANWILLQLIEHGWLEKQVDEATLQSSYNFTRLGRAFTEPFVEADTAIVRTRHRNTRNVRNAMSSFAQTGEVYDLLDAWEYSERIISDFTDIIAELDERKRSLVRQMETQLQIQQATADFFDFMEKRFQPDLAVRLSADNVEKYRDQIVESIQGIRQRDRAFKRDVEKRLRTLLPEMVQAGQSLLWVLLDSIEARLQAASDIMLPALRRALQGFTKRADMIIRQINYLSSSSHSDMVKVCQQLAEKPIHEQDQLLANAGALMAVPRIALLDPANTRLQQREVRRQFDLTVTEEHFEDIDLEARKSLLVQQWLDQAFLINDNQVRGYLAKHLSHGEAVLTSQLPVQTAADFLALSHAIEVGSASSLHEQQKFQVTYVATEPQQDPFFRSRDVFEIRLNHDATSELEEQARVSGH